MNTFLFKLILPTKSTFEYLKFEFWIFQTTSNGETTKVKDVDLEKLNFVVDNIFLLEIILSTKTKFEFLKFEIQTL